MSGLVSKASRAVLTEAAVRIYFETVLTVIGLRKSRAVACAAGAAIGWAEGMTLPSNPRELLKVWLESISEHAELEAPKEDNKYVSVCHGWV